MKAKERMFKKVVKYPPLYKDVWGIVFISSWIAFMISGMYVSVRYENGISTTFLIPFIFYPSLFWLVYGIARFFKRKVYWKQIESVKL